MSPQNRILFKLLEWNSSKSSIIFYLYRWLANCHPQSLIQANSQIYTWGTEKITKVLLTSYGVSGLFGKTRFPRFGFKDQSWMLNTTLWINILITTLILYNSCVPFSVVAAESVTPFNFKAKVLMFIIELPYNLLLKKQ